MDPRLQGGRSRPGVYGGGVVLADGLGGVAARNGPNRASGDAARAFDTKRQWDDGPMRLTLEDGTEIEISEGPNEEGLARRVSDEAWTEAPTIEQALAQLLGVSEKSAAESLTVAMLAQGGVRRTRSLNVEPSNG